MTLPTSYLLYAIFALGGAGVYFMMPRSGRSLRAVGALFGLAALAALVVVLTTRVLAPGQCSGFFHLFALIALAAGARVITHPRPVFSALYFVLVIVAVAALLVLQQAEFLAIALIIIYAGAILVTYVFVIMLAHPGGETSYDRRAREPLAGVLAGFVLMATVAAYAEQRPAEGCLASGEGIPHPSSAGADSGWALTSQQTSDQTFQQTSDQMSDQARPESALADEGRGNTLAVGNLVMTKFVVALEIAGVLLLVAMVGAVALSRKRIPVEAAPTPRVLGEVGKKVKPY